MQLVIQGPLENIIQVNVFGKFKMSLNAVWFVHNGDTVEKLIQLKSPQFRLKYSSGIQLNPDGSKIQLFASPYPIFVSTPAAQIGGLNGSIQWEADIQGSIQLQMGDLLGSIISNLDSCVVNINITKLDD